MRINETDPAIQRNDLFVRRFLKRKSKFLRTLARSNGTFSRFFIDRMPFLSVRMVRLSKNGIRGKSCARRAKTEGRYSAGRRLRIRRHILVAYRFSSQPM